MSETESQNNLEGPPQRPDESSFSYLMEHPTVQGWKRRLYALIAGESSETLSKLGSIEQYIRVLLAESKENRGAEYCFREALSQIIQEWTPTVLEPANRLNNYLSLIAAFTPSVGFTKVLDYMEKMEDFTRIDEGIPGQQDAIDLHKKGLIALAQYYRTPPAHSQSDFGFLAYKELLERNLRNDRDTGYAAVRLLQLKVLDVKSQPFASLFLSSDKVAKEVFQYLLDAADEPRQMQTVQEKLGDLLVICAKADDLDRFRRLAEINEAVFSPEGDYQIFFPTLTLANGLTLDVYLDMEEVKETALSYYIQYSTDKIHELFRSDVPDGEKLGRYVSAYIAHFISQPDALNDLTVTLKKLGARIVPNRSSANTNPKSELGISVDRSGFPKDVDIYLAEKIQIEFLKWYFKQNQPLTAKNFKFKMAGSARAQ